MIQPREKRISTGKVWTQVQIDAPRCGAQKLDGQQCARIRDRGQAGGWRKLPDGDEVWLCTQHQARA